MEKGVKTITPKDVYDQCVDKQRIVIAGKQSALIAALTLHTLRHYQREFDFLDQHAGTPVVWTSAPVIIIQEDESFTPDVLDYHHHIGVLSDFDPSASAILNQFADSSAKGGILIYGDTEPVQSICKKERTDVSSILFKEYPSATDNGSVALISSTNEKVPVNLSGRDDLRSVSAAKELLKKIGISSGQFYRAMSLFKK